MKNAPLLGIAGLIVATSIGYYFGFYVPGKELFARQQYCAGEGAKYLQQEQNSWSGGDLSGSFLGNGAYVYSPKLKTCLYANSLAYTSKDTSKTEYYIIDLNTNNKIASYNWWQKGCDSCAGDQVSIDAHKEYEEIYKENFEKSN